ncbi:DNA adenine methylase [Qipengyuania soli]|uniref:DNA adenine methylase n=1 Tax=Qipengyuania soli TaxID=2782568 RepID=A0A7S8F6U8_9SPHN|nr:DNA adenine methylase [Qipengyuania soli]QPD00211.1 DNA adenine methylase [Qipengyuania soli]
MSSFDRFGAGSTPFRYPGGKASLTELLAEKIRNSDATITSYAEPYAGGAGAAIELLNSAIVDAIFLNDFDRRIYAAWWAMLNHTDLFIERIRATAVDIDTWRQHRDVVESEVGETDLFELGFSTYYLNRTNHSGVILGAGPIGGISQLGKWKIDARWYPETMAKRIKWLGQNAHRIILSNRDGLRFLREFEKEAANSCFFFIDPPYVRAGKKLYLNGMNDLKHRDLAKFLQDDNHVRNWLVTYDDCSLIRENFEASNVGSVPVKYSMRRRRTEQEICVTPY